MVRVAVTGASGFVGRRVVESLLERGYTPVALSRNPEKLPFPAGVDRRSFDPNAGPSAAAFEGVDAVIHLAGESVAGRWTAAKKRAIYDSRIGGTRCVVQSIAACTRKPGVLVSASASGYYGSRGDEPLFETSAPGNDFLSLCADWEREAANARAHGVRVAYLRTGIVLGRGGALAQMLPIFRLGAGGPLGGGRQFVPWIHVDDLAALYIFAIENAGIDGAVNAVTPDYATNARFSQAIGAAVRRPAIVPAPAPALRLALGEFAQALLSSQLMIPAVAEDAGFTWRQPLLEAAVADAVGSGVTGAPNVRRFTSEQIVDAPIDDVFAFFSEARNLEAITPELLRFTITKAPALMQRGAQIEYKLRLRGLNAGWKTMIARWDPPHAFVDVQLHGPYAFWQHTHTFTPLGDRVRINDEVLYALPLAPFSRLAEPLVRRDVSEIFSYRRAAIQERYPPSATVR